jgi:proteic killer suppression protein
MDICFRTTRLQKVCNDSKRGIQRYGSTRFGMIRLRLDDLHAANNLAEMRNVGGCHALKGKRAGEFAVSLDGGWRLVFVPATEPVPLLPDGGIDRKLVTAIEVISIEDYHG